MSKKSNDKIPSISIVVAAYNAEKYLKQCISSMLKQTYQDFEIILVDDGSTDDTAKLCDEYAKKDKRIKVIHQKNSGQTVARQNGVIESSGKYILIFDSDDWLELNALEVAIKAAEEHDADIVTFNGYFNYSYHRCPIKQPTPSGFFDKKGLIKHVYPTMIYSGRFFIFGIFAAMWNKLYRRELILPNLMNVDPRVKIYEDGLATFATFLDAERVCVLGDEYLYNYRDNQFSLTRSYCKNQFDSTIIMIRDLKKICQKRASTYDLSDQVDLFYLFILRSIIEEEFYFKHKKSLVGRYNYVKKIINDTDAQKTLKSMSFGEIKQKMGFFFIAMRLRFTFLAILIAVSKSYKMRLRVYIRRKLKRY